MRADSFDKDQIAGLPRGGARGRLAVCAALAVCAFQLAACATPYQEMGLRGGVRAVQISSNVAQVTARGSSATDPDKIERYVLRKAAETTLAAGYDRFEVIATSDRSRTIQGIAGYTATAVSGFPSVGLTMPFIRPGETVLIRMTYAHAPMTSEPPTVFDAQEVVEHLSLRHGQP